MVGDETHSSLLSAFASGRCEVRMTPGHMGRWIEAFRRTLTCS